MIIFYKGEIKTFDENAAGACVGDDICLINNPFIRALQIDLLNEFEYFQGLVGVLHNDIIIYKNSFLHLKS